MGLKQRIRNIDKNTAQSDRSHTTVREVQNSKHTAKAAAYLRFLQQKSYL